MIARKSEEGRERMTATVKEKVTYQTLVDMFETKTRDSGEKFVSLRDDAPEWTADFIREAHGTDMMPDDYRYQTILEALQFLAENEDESLDDTAHGFADDVDVYTYDLTAWLGSHVMRPGYCDQANEDGLVERDADIIQRISAGQYVERTEIFWNVVRAALPYIDSK